MKKCRQSKAFICAVLIFTLLLAGCSNLLHSPDDSSTGFSDLSNFESLYNSDKTGETQDTLDSNDSNAVSISELIDETDGLTEPSAELTSDNSGTSKSPETASPQISTKLPQKTSGFNYEKVPAYSGSPYYAVNNNYPYFTANDYTDKSFEKYSSLDSLGRCGVANACIGKDIMPTEDRGSIGQVKPTGWHTVKYDIVDGKYLYNRCHLIGYQLSGENANTQNLITGTRYLNVQGMLPFENMVADYVNETENHVLYRVTPIFEKSNLLSKGVLIEAYSVEDDGDGICFCVFVYNVQPGISIDYSTGDSYLEHSDDTEPETTKAPETTKPPETTKDDKPTGVTYILNTNTKKFHYPDCSSVKRMSEKNKMYFTGDREEVIAMGYVPCKNCNP